MPPPAARPGKPVAEARLAALVEDAARLVAGVGEDNFCATLVAVLTARAAADSVVLLAYHDRFAPRVLYQAMDPGDAAALHGRYFEDAYLLSPFYLAWRAAPAAGGFYRLRDEAPEGFFDSTFYIEYYARSGLADEVAFVVPQDAASAVLVSLGRTAALGDFDAEERQALAALAPLVQAAVRRHFALAEMPAGGVLRRRLDDALAAFGAELLTGRERMVAQMMLRGHSSKSCARALSISPTTERVHRRNIYAKLGISSQAELFARFFDEAAG